METKREDRRASYSKKMIRESLFELMKEKPLNKVTVKEICEKADVNRSTFYSYYLDIYDLHSSIIKEFFSQYKAVIQKTQEILLSKDDMFSLALSDYYEIAFYYLNTVKNNRELYKFIFNQNSTNAIHISYGKIFYRMIRDIILAEHPEEKTIWLKQYFTFISGGTTAIIMEWLKRDRNESIEVLAGQLAAFYYGIFNAKKK